MHKKLARLIYFQRRVVGFTSVTDSDSTLQRLYLLLFPWDYLLSTVTNDL